MLNRIPLIALQKALYTTLTTYQTTPVYDDVPADAVLPYISLGAFTCKPNGAKRTQISDVSIQIHIWSSYKGKAEVNSIANDVIAVLSSVYLDLAADNFETLNQDVDFFEAFEADQDGYHGVITLIVKIQNVLQN